MSRRRVWCVIPKDCGAPSAAVVLLVFLICVVARLLLVCAPTIAQTQNEPVIDVHLRAMTADSLGPPPVFICAPSTDWPVWDPKTGGEAFGQTFLKHPDCESPLQSPNTDNELMQRTLAIVQARNVIAVTSGNPLEIVMKWKLIGGKRILPATDFDPKSGIPSVGDLRDLAKSGQLVAIAEVGQQYQGIAANDPLMEPYYALAEELDIPIGIHMGPGPPGAAYFFAPDYRIKHSSLLLLEDVLVRHPKLRLWAMHAGWPLADDAIAALYAHPQLYVDTGVIDYAFPRKQFYCSG